MSETKGRGGFDTRHHKTREDRAKLLREAMRELYPGASEEYAKVKPHLVLEDEAKNKAYVNDGNGGLRRCTDPNDVLKYADERVSRLHMKRNEKRDYLFSTFLLHLPKNYCEEIRDYYEDTVTIKNKKTGEKTTKKVKSSRWIAKDEKQAEAYFSDTIEFLARCVIPGGYDAILGVDVQYSETTPHIHILADTYENDPAHPGKLRNSHGRAYGHHPDVVYRIKDEDGKPRTKQISGKAKMRDYHKLFKEYMIVRGWDIESEVSDRSKEKLSQNDFEELQMWQTIVDLQAEENEKELVERAIQLQAFAEEVHRREAEVTLERHELEKERDALEQERAEIRKNLQASKRDRDEAAQILARNKENKGVLEEIDLFINQAKAHGWNPERPENLRKRYKTAAEISDVYTTVEETASDELEHI